MAVKAIRKRDGRIVPFESAKITEAIFRAAVAVGGKDRELARTLCKEIVEMINSKFSEKIPTVEDVQDTVEKVLIENGHARTSKAYILYRDQHSKLREVKTLFDSIEIVEDYVREEDWRVKENANMSYSLQGLNNHITSRVIAKYWLKKIYPKEVRIAHQDGDLHIHDLSTLGPYCVGWDLQDVLLKGFRGVPNKIESAPAKHFRAALGQAVNFLYTLQGECYSDDTEVLTNNGWKLFKNLDLKKDKLFTLNQKTKEIELQKPLRFFEFENRQMVSFCNSKIDLLVTENHNVLVDKYRPDKKRNDYNLTLVKANKFNTNTHLIPKGGVWMGKEKKLFSLPSISIRSYRNYGETWKIEKKKDVKIPMNDWLAFFGLWIAEGSSSKILKKPKDRKHYYEYYIRISQDNKENHGKIENMLNQLPFHWNKKTIKNKTDFVIYGKQLYTYLSQFGKSGDKFLPKEIKESSKRQLEILFSWMMFGDGHISKNGNYEYYTKSKRLADDVQEIILKLGMNANIRQKSSKLGSWYVVAVSRTKYFKLNQRSVKKVNNGGKVYCVEVPNHTLYVRRNGKACWCGNSAGAQAFSNFDTLLAPFIRYDKLNYKGVKQAMQEFIFNSNVPTRVGFQSPFINVTMDLEVPNNMKNSPSLIGGKPAGECYGEYGKEMELFNRAFAEIMMKGDAKGRIFSFPIPTYNLTKDFDWDNPAHETLWQMTAKYGIPYFSNFINSDMNPEDARSMCCRLRLDNKELRKRGGGLFGSAPKTGSIGVVTLNMARMGYLSEGDDDFFERLGYYMGIAKSSLETKRKVLETFTEGNLYPYSKYYLQDVKAVHKKYWQNHFSTIGLNGMNECCLNFMGKTIATKEGRDFAVKTLKYMRSLLQEFQEDTGNNYNLESTPAEGTSFRLAKIDRERFSNIITAGKEHPYYTNSTQLPVDFTEDLFEALDLQDELQCLYTGGCIEKGNKVLTNKGMFPIEEIVKNFKGLRPIKALSYNVKLGKSEWDEILKAVKIDVKKHNKIRIKAERNLDITTSDWHPFFVFKRIKINSSCPICKKKVSGVKGFAVHLKYNQECRKKYSSLSKYQVVEKRADELKKGDYILQNSDNLYPEKITELNEDLMWLIGFFIGDGAISKYIDNRGGNNLKKYRVRFFSEHKAVLEKVAKILNKYFGCKVKVIKNDKRSKVLMEVCTSKKEISEFFFKYGLKPGKKAYNISIPLEIKNNLNKNNVYSLLSGLMDSDGHIDRRQSDFEYYTVSSQLADDILEICTRAGIMISKSLKLTKRKNEVNIYRLRIPSSNLTKMRNKLDNIVNRSYIKKELSNRKRRHFPVVRVKGVSKVDVKDNKFYDLMTKKNHNYLAGKNSLVFIHNTVFHAYLGERIAEPESCKALVKKIAHNYKMPYFSITPTFSVCQDHGYLSGEQHKCHCGKACEVYSRIVGYYRPIQNWNKGKREEFGERKLFAVPNVQK
ncbi:MAG: ribonucleoside triphosphate reductase [Candidatus Woesearchaeota archaeon]